MDDFPQAVNRRIPEPHGESDASRLTQVESPIEGGALEDAALDDFDAEVASVSERIREPHSLGLTPKQIRDRLPGVSSWAVNCAINRDAQAKAVHPGLRARALRLEGKTYEQIRAEVCVSSATLSMWLRDLPYPKPDSAAHAAHMNRVQKAHNDERRAAEKVAAFAEIGRVSDRELMLLGVALYWVEGARDKPQCHLA